MQHKRKITRTILILLTLATTNLGFGQSNHLEGLIWPDFLSRIQGKDSLVDVVLGNREQYRFQFIMTEIVEDKSTFILGQTRDYSAPWLYFYPASMVKLPIALMTLEDLKRIDHSTKATLRFDYDFTCGNMAFVEESQKEALSFEKMIRELIIVSNNTYYNSLYHFLSPEKINKKLQEKGLGSTSIYRDFTGCEMPLNLKTHGFRVQEEGSGKIGVQGMKVLELNEFTENYQYDTTKLLGSKHEYRGKIVDGPFDFNYNLEYALRDIHSTSMRLFFPQFFDKSDCWDIREEDRQMLLTAMKSVPKDLNEKKFYDTKKYPDNLYKYIVLGDDNPKYDSVITYSKIGISYGFVTETAYVHDPKTNKHYVLTASIYVNSNDTVNDGKYEYEAFARPFLARLGQVLLEME